MQLPTPMIKQSTSKLFDKIFPEKGEVLISLEAHQSC